MRYHSSRIRRLVYPTAAMCAAVLSCMPAAAQNFKALPLGNAGGQPIQSWSQIGLKEEAKAVTGMLAGTSPVDPVLFDKFFNEWMFPLFTQYEPIKLGARQVNPLIGGTGGIESPSKMRTFFKSTYAQKATNPQAHQHLLDITLKKMDEIASDNFHPVCRANAMMMIADLNQNEASFAPYPGALPALLNGVTAPTTIDAVRIPALRGLVRQAQNGIATTAQAGVIKAMVDLQAVRNPPADRTQEGHDWICRRAIDVLEAMKNPGQNGAVMIALMKTVDDQTASIAVRTAAARAVGNIPYTPPAGFNTAQWINSLGKLAVDCYKDELKGIDERKPIVADRLKTRLNETRNGLVGPNGKSGMITISGPAVANANLALFVTKQVDNLIGTCATPVPAPAPPKIAAGASSEQFMALPPDPQKPLADAIQKAGQELETALKRGPGAAPAPAEGPAVPTAAPAGQNPF